jgi:hypothetical protein
MRSERSRDAWPHSGWRWPWIAVLIASLHLIAASLKVLDGHDAAWSRLPRSLHWGVVVLEMALAAGLLWPRTRLPAACLSLSFGLGGMAMLALGPGAGCGCFGRHALPPAWHGLVLGGLAAGSWLVIRATWPAQAPPRSVLQSWKQA